MVLVAVAAGGCATASVPTPAPVPAPVVRRRAPPPPIAPTPTPVEPAPLPVEPAPEAPTLPEAPAEEGVASYYADSLAGRRTASGERYRPDEATCAHRKHPFGTRLQVTAVGSGKSAECRVNDRGPFVEGRVLDVSKKVARQLGMIGPGVLRVRVVVVIEP